MGICVLIICFADAARWSDRGEFTTVITTTGTFCQYLLLQILPSLPHDNMYLLFALLIDLGSLSGGEVTLLLLLLQTTTGVFCHQLLLQLLPLLPDHNVYLLFALLIDLGGLSGGDVKLLLLLLLYWSLLPSAAVTTIPPPPR